MPVTEHVLTYNFADILGDALDPKHTIAWVETNVDHNVIVDTGSGGKVLAGAVVIVNKDTAASGTVSLPTTAGATNPTGFQYRVWCEYRSIFGAQFKKDRWNSGWFSLTAPADLKDVVAEQYVPPTYASQLTAQLDAHEAELEDDLTAHAGVLQSGLTQAGLGNFDEALTLIDADAASDFRQQQDARQITAFARRWQPNTAYAAGATVVAPDGSLVKAKTAFTSGSAYSAANWTSVAAYAGTQAKAELDAVVQTQTGLALDKQAPRQPRFTQPVDLSAALTPAPAPYSRSDGLVTATGFDRQWLMIGEDWQMHVVNKQDFSTYRAERAADWSLAEPWHVSPISKVIDFDSSVESNNTFFGGIAKETWTYLDPEINLTSTTGYAISVGTGDETNRDPSSGIYNPPAVMFWREGASAAQSLTKRLSNAGIMGGVTSSPRNLQGASRTAADTFFLYGSGNNQSTAAVASRPTFGKMVLTLNSAKSRLGASAVTSLTWTDYLSVLQATVTAAFPGETIVNVPACADQLVGGVLYVLVTTLQSGTYRTRMVLFTPASGTATMDTTPRIQADATSTAALYPMTPIASTTDQTCGIAVGTNGVLMTVKGVGGASYAWFKPNASAFWRDVSRQVRKALGENGVGFNAITWDATRSRFLVCGGFQATSEAGWLDANCQQGRPLTAALPAPQRFAGDSVRSAIGIYADADGTLVLGARQLAMYLPQGSIEPPPSRVIWGLRVTPTATADQVAVSAGEAWIYRGSAGPPLRVYSAGHAGLTVSNLNNTFTIVLTTAGVVQRPGESWASGADVNEVAMQGQVVLAVIDRTATGVVVTPAEIDQTVFREQ